MREIDILQDLPSGSTPSQTAQFPGVGLTCEELLRAQLQLLYRTFASSFRSIVTDHNSSFTL